MYYLAYILHKKQATEATQKERLTPNKVKMKAIIKESEFGFSERGFF